MARRASKPAQRDRHQAVLEAHQMIEQLVRQDGNEAETRRRVERILESVLGYDAFQHLSREHAVRGAGETEHVDFAIQIDSGEHGRPTILVELKRVGIDLARKHLKQISSYAINTGCEWILLTNGRQWGLYHVAFGQPPVTKLLVEWNLLKDDLEEVLTRFELISYASVKKGVLEELWRKRKVLDPCNLLQAILSDPSMKVLRRELRRSTKVPLSPEDVIGGVRRLLNENALAIMEEMTITFPPRRRRRRDPDKAGPHEPRRPGATLGQLIEAGVLAAPLSLYRDYKGQHLEATLHPDGTIEFQGTHYDNPSKAGSAARSGILGRPVSTHGWRFWRFADTSGAERSLADARDEFLRRGHGRGE